MQQLPAKDLAVFRSIVKFYETKQYKKGVKAADSILKKNPDHGETLCMKGLTLSYLDRKEEAYELVRKGLKHDLRSHVCWHVYGLLYRQDRDYFEAVKCYRNALRIDPDNIQILRDLSLLQIHRRDLTGFAETRRKLLQVKPSNRLNWLGYAIAEHLCKSFEFAWTCIDNYEKTFKDESVPDYENSELFLYKATIMEEAGTLEEALECVKQHEREIVDKLALYEMKGRLCMFLERYGEAAEIFRRLIMLNPEHHVYILAYMASQPQFHRFLPALTAPQVYREGDAKNGHCKTSTEVPRTMSSFPVSMHPEGMPTWGWLPPQHALKPQKRVAIGSRQHKRRLDSYEPLVPLTEEEEEAVCKFFGELQEAHPRSDSLQRLELHFITGERFKKRIDAYLRTRLRKGVPSLFRMMRPLYFQKGKPEVIEQLLTGYVKHLAEEISWFGPQDGETDTTCDELNEEPPSSYLFALMMSAEHYDFLGNTQVALDYADKAIEHTPTFVEIYACKARIYKHAGDFAKSAHWFNEVRSMDLADRFLNTQCVRAYLRVDDVQSGMEKALLFSHSKEPEAPDGTNLHDMQCMWYESAVGRSYYRQKNFGKALKEFGETFKHFNDIAEDQFDFHNYCLRKTTLKTYVAMLRMQERLYSHKFYRRAAKDAIRIHMELYDQKSRGDAMAGTAVDNANKEVEMSKEEKLKQKHKNKRAKKKEDEAKEAKVTAGGKPKKVDDDPEGDKLLEKDPMDEAPKLVKNLVLYSSMDTATHVLTYDVFSRQGRLLHCLQALISLWELSGRDVMNYKLIAPLAHFCFVAKLDDKELNPAIKEVVLSELVVVFGEEAFADLAALRAAATRVVDAVDKKLRDTPELPLIEVIYGLKCLRNAGRDCKDFLEGWRPDGAFALKECRKMLDYLAGEYGIESSIRQRFKDRCLEVFPLMVIA